MTNKTNQTPIFDLTTFNIKKDSAIEASAGTGKTYTIKKIIKKILLDGVSNNSGVISGRPKTKLEQILIVTYTEKAAGELKERIRDEITTPLVELNGQSIAECFPEYCDIEKATIGTIHSFCQSTIAEFAISSNQPLGLELAGDNAIKDFAKAYIRQGNIFTDINNYAQQGSLIDEDKLIKNLVSIANKYYLDSANNEVPSIIKYEQPLAVTLYDCSDVRQTLLENADPKIYDLYDSLANNGDPNVQNMIASFNDFKNLCASPATANSFGIKKGKNVLYTKEFIEGCNKLLNLAKQYNGFTVETILTTKYIKDFYASYQEYKAANRLQTFNDMLRVVREEVIKKDSALLKKLKSKYIYGIIDEFQDTNQIQFDVFEKVFLKDEKNKEHFLIVVGDPKQSIYAFQGADVDVYLKAVEEITKNGDKWRLATNHRSAAGIVEFGNKLFPKYFNPTNNDGIVFDSSAYCYLGDNNCPQKERRIKYDGKYCSSLWLPNKVFDNEECEEYAKYVVQEILNCLEVNSAGETRLRLVYLQKDDDGNIITKNGQLPERNVTFGDFVILARAKSEMSYIQKVLKNAGIPNIRYKDDTLFQGVECAHWIALLEAIDAIDFTGGNRRYFKKALYTKFFNYSLNEISKEIYDQDQISEIKLFEKWKRMAKEESWEALFDTIIADTELNKTLSSNTEVKTLANFKQIADYAIEYLSNGFKIKDFIDHLNKIVSFGNDESEGDNPFIIARASSLDCVRLMTIHASKGLQFPVVISTAGWAGSASSSDCYSFHRTTANGHKEHIVTLEKGSEVSEEDIREYYRLLYVDYTRPEYLLIMPRFDRGDKTGRPYVRDAIESFIKDNASETFKVDDQSIPLFELRDTSYDSYDDMEIATKAAIKRINDAKGHTKETDQNKKDQNSVLKSLIKEEKNKSAYQHSYSTLAHPSKEETFDEENILDREEIIEDDLTKYDEHSNPIDGKYDNSKETAKTPDGYPKGSGMGNAIHEVFENINFENPDHNVEDIIIDRFKSYGFTFEKSSEFLRHTKEDIVKTVLEADLPEIIGEKATGQYFKLKELSSDNRKAEAEFDFNYPNEKLKNYFIGFIDLLFKREVDGVEIYSVLDWKSDTITDKFLSYKNKTELKKQVDRRYSIQRVLYSYCLIKWLKKIYNITEEEAFNKHFGGIYYVFVRGCNKDTSNGIYAQTWASWDVLEKAFLDICKIK